MKKSSDIIGNRPRDLPACSAVPQPTALPRAQLVYIGKSRMISCASRDVRVAACGATGGVRCRCHALVVLGTLKDEINLNYT
jgi:hypothetical protein